MVSRMRVQAGPDGSPSSYQSWLCRLLPTHAMARAKTGGTGTIQVQPIRGRRYHVGPGPVQGPTCGPTQRLRRSFVCANSAPHITWMLKASARRRSLSCNGR